MRCPARPGLFLGLALTCSPLVVSGQVPGQIPAGNAADLDRMAIEMSDRVRHLGEDIAADLGRSPGVSHVIQDTRELAESVDEFRQASRRGRDAYAARQSYSAIEGSWQHLKGALTRLGVGSAGVDRSARRVEEADAQLRTMLGLNEPPPDFYYGDTNAPPRGVGEVRRLAHALVDRAEALANAVRIEMSRDPNAGGLLADTTGLARAADQFHDTLDANRPLPEVSAAFAPVDALADRIGRQVNRGNVSPGVRNAWASFAQAEGLIDRELGLDPGRHGAAPVVVRPPQPPPSPIVPLADAMVQQINEFVANYSATARNVPEGQAIYDDAVRLQAASIDFRRAIAGGGPPGSQAFAFREVDAGVHRLSRRVERVARGRNGPNIQQVRNIVATAEGLHTALGMPGYPPAIGVGQPFP